MANVPSIEKIIQTQITSQLARECILLASYLDGIANGEVFSEKVLRLVAAGARDASENCNIKQGELFASIVNAAVHFTACTNTEAIEYWQLEMKQRIAELKEHEVNTFDEIYKMYPL